MEELYQGIENNINAHYSYNTKSMSDRDTSNVMVLDLEEYAFKPNFNHVIDNGALNYADDCHYYEIR